jgi:hypothetical protein
MIRFLPLVIPLVMAALYLGFYWGRNHQQRMSEIDEPDEPQIFSDGGPKVENDALTAEELDRHTDEEIATLLEDRE